jgi:IclR family acetate operon transcriptional repressor
MLKNTALARFTKNTITDANLLKKELKRIRKQGFAFSDQEADLGAKAIGAPILNHKGELVAGLSIAGPKERITNKNIPKLIRLVQGAAEKASHDLGHRAVRV